MKSASAHGVTLFGRGAITWPVPERFSVASNESDTATQLHGGVSISDVFLWKGQVFG